MWLEASSPRIRAIPDLYNPNATPRFFLQLAREKFSETNLTSTSAPSATLNANHPYCRAITNVLASSPGEAQAYGRH